MTKCKAGGNIAMDNETLYRDILSMIFSNETNKEYFRKYYSENKLYQVMLRDYLKFNHETSNIRN